MASGGPTGWLLAWMPAIFVLIWSTGFVVARYGMPHSPPLTFLGWRYALSIAAFGLWIAWSRPPWPRDRAQWLHLAVTGVLMHAGYLGGVWAAVRHGIPAGTVALIVGLQPLLTALWMARVASAPGPGRTVRSAISAREWAGLWLGLGGLLLVVWRKLGVGEVDGTNLALAVLALASITAGTLYQKRHVLPCDVRTANAVQLVAALAVTAPLAMLEPGAMVLHPELIGAMAWSVGVLTLGGSSLLYMLLQRGAATRVTSLFYMVPPCTAVFAWWLFDEALTPVVLAGMALAALGVWLVVGPRQPRV